MASVQLAGSSGAGGATGGRAGEERSARGYPEGDVAAGTAATGAGRGQAQTAADRHADT